MAVMHPILTREHALDVLRFAPFGMDDIGFGHLTAGQPPSDMTAESGFCNANPKTHEGSALIEENTMNKEIKASSTRMLNRANELGLTGKSGAPLDVRQMAELLAAEAGYRSCHAHAAALVNREAPALRLQKPDESGCNYELISDARGVWLKFGQYQVHVYFPHGDEGIIADIHNAGQEDNTLASAQLFHPDAEFALAEDLAVDIDEVAEWVGLHYGRNFEAEPAAKRSDWIRRYVEANSTAADAEATEGATFVCANCGQLHPTEDRIDTQGGPVGTTCLDDNAGSNLRDWAASQTHLGFAEWMADQRQAEGSPSDR